MTTLNLSIEFIRGIWTVHKALNTLSFIIFMPFMVIPFALQISALSQEALGCSVKALPAWSWHRAYMDVFTASFDGHPKAEFSSTMGI